MRTPATRRQPQFMQAKERTARVKQMEIHKAISSMKLSYQSEERSPVFLFSELASSKEKGREK